MARTATRRTTTGRTRSARATTTTRPRARKLERCPHGLLKGTCAICLQIEETVDLTTGKLAPEERKPGLHHAGDEEDEED
ncbi:MAG TPA: hypothetical protein VJA65_07910 [bacterium]|nr:hypothetical protein [bacterium]